MDASLLLVLCDSWHLPKHNTVNTAYATLSMQDRPSYVCATASLWSVDFKDSLKV